MTLIADPTILIASVFAQGVAEFYQTLIDVSPVIRYVSSIGYLYVALAGVLVGSAVFVYSIVRRAF